MEELSGNQMYRRCPCRSDSSILGGKEIHRASLKFQFGCSVDFGIYKDTNSFHQCLLMTNNERSVFLHDYFLDGLDDGGACRANCACR